MTGVGQTAVSDWAVRGARVIPTGPEQLTTDWLAEALSDGRAAPPAVEGFAVEPLGAGRGFVGRVVRICLRYAPGGPAGPPSVVAKFPSYDHEGKPRMAETNVREVRVYGELARQEPALYGTPVVYVAASDPGTGKTVLLLEDLGAGTAGGARAGDNVAGCTRDEALLAVTHVARLHAAWWNSPRLAALDWVSRIGANGERFEETYRERWGVFVDKFGASLPPLFVEIGTRLRSTAARIRSELDGEPLTLLHGDYRLDNMFFVPVGAAGGAGGGERLVVVDWQSVVQGRGVCDVAYFAGFCLPPADRREWEADLLGAYHEALVRHGVSGYGFERCALDYRRASFRPFLTVVMAGAVLDLSSDRGLELVRVLVERCTAQLEDLRALEFLP